MISREQEPTNGAAFIEIVYEGSGDPADTHEIVGLNLLDEAHVPMTQIGHDAKRHDDDVQRARDIANGMCPKEIRNASGVFDCSKPTGHPERCHEPASLFEVIDSNGDTTFQLTAAEAGQWLTDALNLPHAIRPPLLVFKACSLGGA